MKTFQDYTITIHTPENENQLWGARCEELKLNASGESQSEAFYNLIENIPAYFEIKSEDQRHRTLTKKGSISGHKTFKIPAFA